MGLHENILQSDFLVVSNRGELYLSAAFGPIDFLLQVEVNAGQRSAFMCQKIVFDTKLLGFRARATQKFRLNFCTF